MKKLSQDFGVRALLATISILCFEVIIMATLVALFARGILNFESALAIAGLAQTPALLCLGFYFGTKSGQIGNGTP